ncbi:hypothetical protein XELAEV_18047393mg, partial [Xenopus laevis]
IIIINYSGHQYFLKRGEYPDFQQWYGFNDSIRSCRIIPQQRGAYKIKIFEREDFRGDSMEFTDDCTSVHEHFKYNDINSCNIYDGQWIFYELPNYRGHQYYLIPRQYKRYSDWGAMNARVGSFRCVRDSY